MTTTATLDTVTRQCRRCHGRGIIPAFVNINGGICNRCQGRGTVQRYTAAAQAVVDDRFARHAVLSHEAAAKDAALRPSKRHFHEDLVEMEANDPEAYEAALAAVVL